MTIPNSDPDLLDEYDFRGASRGKYAECYAQGTNVVLLAPDVAEAFPTERDVNAALRSLMRLQGDLRSPARELPAK